MKKLVAAALAVLLTANLGMTCPAAETADVSGENAVQEEQKTVGEKTEDAQFLELKNGTGKDITAFAIKLTGAEEEDFSENLLPAEDVFADGETRTFFYAAKKQEDGEDSAEAEDDTEAEASEETESVTQEDAAAEPDAQDGETGAEEKPQETLMVIRLTFADDTTAELHVWALEEIEAFEICLEEKTAYLSYEKEGQEMSTLEWEKEETEEAESAETSAPEEEIVEYDDYYEEPYYEDTYYDGSYYDDSAYYDDGGAAENCLQGGLMN